MSVRLKVLIDELTSPPKERVLLELPDLPFKSEEVFEVFDASTLSKWVDELSERVREFIKPILGVKGREDYAYSITYEPIKLILAFVANVESHPRFGELRSQLSQLATSLQDNLWELYAHYKVLAEAERTPASPYSEAMEKVENYYVKNLYKFYLLAKMSKKFSVTYDEESDAIQVVVPQEYAGHFIGKGGQRVKEVQEIAGMRVKVVPA